MLNALQIGVFTIPQNKNKKEKKGKKEKEKREYPSRVSTPTYHLPWGWPIINSNEFKVETLN